MDLRQLGQTDLKVSPLGLGTVKFGRNEGLKYPEQFKLPDETHLRDLLDLAKSVGINTLDTAPAYGTSEERLGRLLAQDRDDWVIIGKAGEIFENGESSYDFTPDFFERSLEQSLKRLNVNHIDVFLIHSNGRDLAILQDDALIQKLHDFKSQGLIKAHGASTKSMAGGIVALEKLDVVMATYNTDYTDEKPVLDHALINHKGVILKKALASGHAQSPADALKFALSHEAVSTTIVGTINPRHLQENVTACVNALS